MKKDIWILILSLVALLLTAGILIAVSLKVFKKEPLNQNGSEMDLSEYHFPEKINSRGLNLIFFADQYESWQEFEQDIDSILNEIKKIEPWKSYNDYNIYRINPRSAQGLCYVKVKDERKPSLRCKAEINEYLSKLPLKRFKLIILSRQSFESWANVVRLENSGIFFSLPSSLETESEKQTAGYLFEHLLGHSFGLKDEEYFVIAKHGSNALSPDGPNCAPDKETAEKWWGILTEQYPEVGYFKECCGSKEYIKPVQSSLMNLNDLDNFVPEYGPVSERYLKKILEYCFSPNLMEFDKDVEFFDRYPQFKTCQNY